jgi:hypothetical protein
VAAVDDLPLRILGRRAHSTLGRKPTRFAGELGVLRFAIWAELPQEADAAGWLAQLSNDYDSEDREQLRQRQIYRGERNASCPQ